MTSGSSHPDGSQKARRILWGPQFSVGNDLMDMQHRILIVQINRLADWIDGSGTRGTYHDILNELMLYSQVHFTTEEAMLERCRYVRIDEQRAEHAIYVTSVTDATFRAMDGATEKQRLHDFLVDWWSSHILVSDMQYRNMIQTPS